MVLASVVMAAILFGIDQLYTDSLSGPLALILLVSAGVVSYGATAQCIGAAKIGELKQAFRKG